MTLLLLTLIAIPLFAGTLLLFERFSRRAYAIAVVASVLELGLSFIVLLEAYGTELFSLKHTPWYIAGYGLGIDALNSVLPFFLSTMTLALIAASPRQKQTPQRFAHTLFTESALVGMVMSQELHLFTACWILSFLPTLRVLYRNATKNIPLRRTFFIMATVSTAFLVIAIIVIDIVTARWKTPSALYWNDLSLLAAPSPSNTIAIVLLWLAALLRTGVFPFHLWLSPLFTQAPIGLSVLCIASRPGIYLLMRAALPLVQLHITPLALITILLGVMTALYSGLVGLVQTNLRRMVSCLALSQVGLILIGASTGHAEGITGALVQWLSQGVVITILALTTSQIHSRCGTLDAHQLQGLAHSAPRLATGFLIAGLAAIGLPGTTGFIAEELLIHGAIDEYPWAATAMVIATALNGIAFLKLYIHVFFGRLDAESFKITTIPDLRPRERIIVLILTFWLIAFGLMPSSMITSRAHAAHAWFASFETQKKGHQ